MVGRVPEWSVCGKSVKATQEFRHIAHACGRALVLRALNADPDGCKDPVPDKDTHVVTEETLAARRSSGC